MPEFNAANFASSLIDDGIDAIKDAAVDSIQQELGNLGPLGNLVAKFAFDTIIDDRTITRAIISSDISTRNDSDWRVSISVPEILLKGDILGPLKANDSASAFNTGNRMVFPFNPVILLGHSAAYSNITPTHTNYHYHAYQSSSIDNITITGEFFNENEADALYWVACVHFLRTMTKMFYGNGANVGLPPLVSHLNGYGKFVLNDIPVVITNFTVDLPADVDYIPVLVPGDKDVNMVPTQSQIAVTCVPNYARRSAARFNLTEFANGNFVGRPEGFV